MIKPHIEIGDTVYWVSSQNKVYKGIVDKYSFCEMQGALYLFLLSPEFKINPYPVVHYTFCFAGKEDADDFAKELKKVGGICKRCDRCEFNIMRLIPIKENEK